MKERPGIWILAAVAAVSSLFSAAPAFADPVLFVGNMVNQRAYNALFAGFALYAEGTTTADVMGSAPASFTIPVSGISGFAAAVSNMASILRELPMSQQVFFFVATFARRNIDVGSFGPVLTPNMTHVLYANTTAYPNDSMTPRSGYMRLKVGTQGFGGNMLVSTTGSYYGRRFTMTTLMSWRMYVTQMWLRGSGTLLGTPATNPSALVGSSYHLFLQTIGGYPLPGSSLIAASTRAPWITGTVTVMEYVGTYPLTLTATGVDNRSPAGMTGNISLVTPQVLNSFFQIGTQTMGRRNQFVSTTTLRLDFAPEPGRLALLAAGLFGLFCLGHRRRA